MLCVNSIHCHLNEVIKDLNVLALHTINKTKRRLQTNAAKLSLRTNFKCLSHFCNDFTPPGDFYKMYDVLVE